MSRQLKTARYHSVAPCRAAVRFIGLLGLFFLLSNGWFPLRAQLVSDGATLSVNATNISLTPTNLVIGSNVPGTRLILTNGGSVNSGAAWLGQVAGSFSNTVLVTGTNSAWTVNGLLTVGQAGASNQVLINNGGAAQATGLLVGEQAGADGNWVSISNGTLRVTNGAGSAVLEARRGEVRMRGGLLVADELLLTNQSGNVAVEAGTLITRRATVANGRDFVIGSAVGAGPALWDVRSNASESVVASNLIVGARVANALRFNGAFQYVAVSNFHTIAPTNEVTVEFWARAEVEAEQAAFMLAPDDFTNRFTARINFVGGQNIWDFGNVSNVAAQISMPTSPGTLGQWVHYALVASQSANEMRIYRNGLLATNRPGMTPFLRRQHELRIGGSTGFFFRGQIDEFRLWRVALPQSQILSNLSRSISGAETNLVLYYRFDSLAGNTATNSALATGAAFDGVLVNGPAWVASDAFSTLAPMLDRAELQLTNGGTLRVMGQSLIGNTAAASNNLVTLRGAGSLWTNDLGVRLGAVSSFNTLLVEQGAQVRSGNDVIGQQAEANFNRALVTGSGSRWQSSGALEIGGLGANNWLTISNGGMLLSSTGIIGGAVISRSNEVLVTGAGSLWTNGALSVGGAGSGNRLRIISGAAVESGTAFIGELDSANANLATIADAGSRWEVSNDLFVGLYGSVNALTITNGGRATNRSGFIGYGTQASTNQVIVAGAGSVWGQRDALTIGSAGSVNQLLVSNGGWVIASAGIVGDAAGANRNSAQVAGAGSLWTNSGNLRVGNFGSFNRLLVSDGGTVLSTSGFLGSEADSVSNLVTVAGNGSVWSNRSNFSVGFRGASNTLVLTNGGRLVNVDAFIGDEETAPGNRAVITGAGSRWINGGTLHVGRFSAGNALEIVNGGTVEASRLLLGTESGSSGNSLTLGNGTLIVTNALANGELDLRRGTLTFDGGTIITDRLMVTNSASVLVFNSGTLITRSALLSNSQYFVIGSQAGGAAATWDVRSNAIPTIAAGGLVVGGEAANVTLLVTNGSRLVTGVSTFIGQMTTANSNRAIVAGPGSSWSSAGLLYVGFDGSQNSLLITNGGRVFSEAAVVGEGPFGGGHQNEARVTGAGSIWSNSTLLTVGTFGSSNRLRIESGGTVWAANAMVGASLGGLDNVIEVNGGSLFVTNAGGTAELEVRHGALALTQGEVVVDALRFTNSSGSWQQTGGTLRARRATVANGQSFVVGDGLNGAVYRMNGGPAELHTFGNGLVISANASLTGNGTVQGAVTNLGMISPGNSGAGSVTINGSLKLAASAGMSFEIGGLLATNQHDQVTVTSFVEFAGTLSLALLPGYEPAGNDVFTLMRFASRTGTFANATNGAVVLTSDRRRQFTVSYGTTNLVAGSFRPSLVLTSIVPSPTSVAVRFQFVAGKTYQVQHSTNLVNWAAVVGASFTEPAPGSRQWVDDGSLTGGLPSERFYRVLELP